MSQSQSSDRSSQSSSAHSARGESPAKDSPAADQARHDAPARFDPPTVISKEPPIPVAGSPDAPRPTELSTSLVGERLDHFELETYIGGGGMGAVFRALDTRLGRTVAIKILPREHIADEDTVRRFRNEAQSGARCDHENIARVYYVGEDRGLPYIAFEYIEGKNLRDLVAEKGPLPLSDAVNYTLQVAEALVHASSRDVIHRDIKPSNILITVHDRVKLVDLGLARLHQAQPSSEDLTASGVTLGTFDYISPEQARDPRGADVRSDMYSLGCTLYFMLTGRPPFPEGTVLQKLLQHQGDAPSDPREFRPALPEEITRILGKMMAKDPRRRYQNPSELVGELVMLAGELGMHLPASAGMVWVQSSDRKTSFFERNVPWIVPVASLIFIVAVLQLMSNSGDRSPPPAPAAPPVDATAEALPSGPDRDSAAATNGQTKTDPFSADVPVPTDERAADNSGNALERTEAVASTPPMGVTTPPGRPAQGSQKEDEIARPTTPSDVTAFPDSLEVELGPPPVEAQGSVAADRSSAGVSVAASKGADVLAVPEARGAQNEVPAELPPDVVQDAPEGDLDTVWIVGRNGLEKTTYPSLRAACIAAQDGDVIELRYNGRRIQRPIELNNVRVTIRAAEDFDPVIVFHPFESDPLRYPRSMITVSGGRLTLVNVALELDLPRDVPVESWALIETQQADELRLDRCSVTVRNASDQMEAYHEQVAVIEVRASPGGDSSVMSDEPHEARPVSIRLQDCIVRGEAQFIRCRDLQPVSLSWQNGLLATTERLVSVEGNQMAPRHNGRIEFDFRHLTAACRRGLILTSSSVDAPYQLHLDVQCTDCVLLLEPGEPMIEQIGVDRVAGLRKRVSVDFDKVFTDGATIFMKIRGMTAQGVPEDLTLPTIAPFFQNSIPEMGRVAWERYPPRDRPTHKHVPTDYRLQDDPKIDNPARRGATDGRDAGIEILALPALPATPVPGKDDIDTLDEKARSDSGGQSGSRLD